MFDYRSFAHTLFTILFVNPHIKPNVRLESLIKLAQIMDQTIPHEETHPLSYLPVIEDLLPKEVAALSPDQLTVAINLLSVSRNPPAPVQRPPDPIVQLCKLLVQKNILTSSDVNAAMEGTEISMAITAHLSDKSQAEEVTPDEGVQE